MSADRLVTVALAFAVAIADIAIVLPGFEVAGKVNWTVKCSVEAVAMVLDVEDN